MSDRYDVYLAPVTGLEWTSIADALMIGTTTKKNNFKEISKKSVFFSKR